eukprot:TRINITY_DN1705_c3_g1_i1.p1 TRINITY_DN1705_c3_g1~~TRINITY_DN1705_c3_g1_i1.p1  ORF type:complete len:346 (+),score=94.80 TRINITY_DN1705_c3_g1_i1:310-1347(+)
MEIEKSLQSATSGMLGSWFATSIIYPLDVVKTRIQSTTSKDAYKGTLDGLLRIVKEEGWRSLYTGLNVMYIKESLKTFVYVFFYELFKGFYIKQTRKSGDDDDDDDDDEKEKKPEMGVLINLVIGCVAGCITQILLNPINVSLARIQTNTFLNYTRSLKGNESATKALSTNLLVIIKEIITKEGFFGLYKGLVPSLILTLNPAIQYMIFDKLKRFWLKYLRKRKRNSTRQQNNSTKNTQNNKCEKKLTKLPSFHIFIIGAIAKIIATLVTYPYIMAKVRMQINKKQNVGTLVVLLAVLKEDGFFGLYSGLQTQIYKSVIGTSLMYMAKEKIHNTVKQIFQLINKK